MTQSTFGTRQSPPKRAVAPVAVRPVAPAAAPALAAPAALPSHQEAKQQRKSPRRRVLKEGKVIFGRSQAVVDCTIDNMSEDGAHIRLISSHGLPEDFYLVEACRGVVHRVEVAWRTTAGMGLQISAPLEDAAARAALLRKFKRG